MRGIRSQRLRNDVAGALMTPETLKLILETHKRFPSQHLYMFTWRHGPSDRWTIYDMDLPRRRGIPADQRKGWSSTDWWTHSTVCNVPSTFMHRWSEKVMVKEESGMAGGRLRSRDVEEIRPGYKEILMRLLREGCVIPSRVLDDWLGDDSRKFADPSTWLLYRGDL